MNSATCVICLKDVDVRDTEKSFISPCCDTVWLHRLCFEKSQTGASNGYRCSACLCKRENPEKSQSVESDSDDDLPLMRAEVKCGAEKCLCEEGRSENHAATQWEVLMCNICQRRGTHKRCSNLQILSSQWQCGKCEEISVKIEVEVDFPLGSSIEASVSSNPLRNTAVYQQTSQRKLPNLIKLDTGEEMFKESHDSIENFTYVPETPPQVVLETTESKEDQVESSETLAVAYYMESSIESKKRPRNPQNWARTRASELRNQGKEYVDREGNFHRERKIQTYEHKCRFQCKLFTQDERQFVFDTFWKLGHYELQNSFINDSVKVSKPARILKAAGKNRSSSATYCLLNRRVCKAFFLKTLDVSNSRVSLLIKKKLNESEGSGISLKGKRGKGVPGNKIDETRIEHLLGFIDSFPIYETHYTSEMNPGVKYLPVGLNLKKMHKLYQEKCDEEKRPPVKESFFRHIFNTRRNLSFNRPQTER